MNECAKCGGPLAVETGEIAALGIRLHIGVLCAVCYALRRAEDEERAASERSARLQAEWERMCPASYLRTDPNHPGLDR